MIHISTESEIEARKENQSIRNITTVIASREIPPLVKYKPMVLYNAGGVTGKAGSLSRPGIRSLCIA